jgi:hypothetical protein
VLHDDLDHAVPNSASTFFLTSTVAASWSDLKMNFKPARRIVSATDFATHGAVPPLLVAGDAPPALCSRKIRTGYTVWSCLPKKA